MRRSLLRSVVLAATALALPASAIAAAPIAHPRGAKAIVIRWSSGGGFVPRSAMLGSLPSFTLYGDGTLIVPGAVPQIFPGPAIAPLLRTRLREPQVQLLLRRAEAAGLLDRGAIDYGDMGSIGVADAPTTMLRISAVGRTIVQHAYALGIQGGRSLPATQAEARRILSSYIARLPLGHAGARYVPRSLAVFADAYAGQAKPGTNTRRWPLALALDGKPVSSGYRCVVVGGAEARTLLATLTHANQQTRWIARGKPYGLIVRPMLPDERGCGSLDVG